MRFGGLRSALPSVLRRLGYFAVRAQLEQMEQMDLSAEEAFVSAVESVQTNERLLRGGNNESGWGMGMVGWGFDGLSLHLRPFGSVGTRRYGYGSVGVWSTSRVHRCTLRDEDF